MNDRPTLKSGSRIYLKQRVNDEQTETYFLNVSNTQFIKIIYQ